MNKRYFRSAKLKRNLLLVEISLLVILIIVNLKYLQIGIIKEYKIDSIISTYNNEFQNKPIKLSKGKILIVTEDYPPYVISSKDNKGICFDIIIKAFKAVDIEVEFESYPVNRCIWLVDSGYAWATFPYVETEKRLENFMFTDSIVTFLNLKTKLFYYKLDKIDNVQKINSVNQIKNYTTGICMNYYYEDFFVKNNVKIDYSKNEKELFNKLVTGKIDFVVSEENVGWYYIEKDYCNITGHFDTIDIGIEKEPIQYRLMVDKNNADAQWFVDEFNRGLKIIEENGVLEKLNNDFLKLNN